MKIGIDARFLTHQQLGGFKTYTENLINALCQVDHNNFYILYLDRQPIDGQLPLSDNFTYKIVPATTPIIGMALREQISLRKEIAKDKLDLFHTLCNTAPVNLPGKLIISLLDVIQVTTPQAFLKARGLKNYKPWAITAYSKWSILKTAHHAKKIITLSYYEKEQIAQVLNLDPQRICVTHMASNPIFKVAPAHVKDIWRCDMRRKFGLPDRFLLGIGYEPRKNIPILIEAFSRIADGQPDLHLVVVAAQEERRRYFNLLAGELGISDHVSVLGSLQPKELAVLYNLAELFVFPSERESFGLPPLEAMSCGTPCITANSSSIPEVVEDAALLVNPTDISGLSSTISKVLMDNKLRNELSHRGLERAKNFSWEKCAKETIIAYEHVFQEM